MASARMTTSLGPGDGLSTSAYSSMSMGPYSRQTMAFISHLFLRVALDFPPRHLPAVHGVGSVGKSQRAHMLPRAGQRMVLADAACAVHLYRLVDYLQRHQRRYDLDLRYPRCGGARIAL